jgi:transcriptional regulator with XRE-family HTH domain
MPEEKTSILASNIKYIRKLHKDTLADLAKRLNVSKSSISDYEKNYTAPSLFFLDAFCQHYNVDLNLIRKVDFKSKSGHLKAQKYGQVVSDSEQVERKQANHRSHALLQQRLEGLEVQLKLMSQLNAARELENKTLKMQLQMLQDRLVKFEQNDFK